MATSSAKFFDAWRQAQNSETFSAWSKRSWANGGRHTHAIVRTGWGWSFQMVCFIEIRCAQTTGTLYDLTPKIIKIGTVVYFNENALINRETQVVKIWIWVTQIGWICCLMFRRELRSWGSIYYVSPDSAKIRGRRSAETSSTRGNLRVTNPPMPPPKTYGPSKANNSLILPLDLHESWFQQTMCSSCCESSPMATKGTPECKSLF